MKDLNLLGCIFLAFFSSYLLQLIDGAKLVINPSGETQNRPAGTGLGITCQGEDENPDLFTDMKWIGPKGDEIPEGGPGLIEVSNPGSGKLVLMFQNPTTEDTGKYSCTAMYSNTDRLNVSVHVTFYHDITWDDCPMQQALVINSDGKIRCRVSANPPATITWYKDSKPLTDRYTTDTDGVEVSGVTEDDKGEFTVRAMVPQTGRFQNRGIKVEVHVPPEIIELDNDPEAIEGSETTLHCRASGFPRPLYSWFDRDQRNLSNVEGHIVDQDMGTIIFQKVRREDHGRYTCMAKNPAGEAKRNLDLSVIVKPEIREFANQTAVQNEEAKFECQAYGEPPPDMSIRKDGRDRPFSDMDDGVVLKMKTESDRTILSLIIERTDRSDDGLYYCTAENKGAQVEKVGHLTVEFAPKLSSTPTSVKTWNGNPVNLTCIAEAIPNATITWSYKQQELKDNADSPYTIYGRSAYSNLLVRPPADPGSRPSVYGIYKCTAKNNHGEEFVNIELQEAHPPSVPEMDREPKTTATTVTFFFNTPKDDGGLPIRAFVVKYIKENEQYSDYQQMEWSEGTPYILQDLIPRTVYSVQFAAKNEAGIGRWSDPMSIVMPAESTPELPKFINPGGDVSTYPDRFQIRWTEPLDNGRKIDFFELRYFEAEKRDNEWKRAGNAVVNVKNITDWENSPKYEMKNLKSNTYYKVEVRAHNNIGFSQDATMVFQTAQGPNGEIGGSNGSGSGLSTGAIAAIIIVLVLIILIVLDVTCYVRYQWGVLFLLRSRVCSKPMVNNKAKEAAVEEGKGGGNEAVANNGDIKVDAKDSAADEKGDMDKKSRTEVDNPAFDKEKELLKSKEDAEKDNDAEVATEDTPMIQTSGAKDSKLSDSTGDGKNKSPKGSKSSIAKDSLV